MKRAWLSIAVTAAGCRSNPNYCEGNPGNSCQARAGDAGGDSSMPDSSTLGSDAPPGYRPTAVSFSTTGADYIDTGAAFVGAGSISQRKGTYSLWIRFTGGDGALQDISVAAQPLSAGVTRTTGNQIRFWLPTCIGGTVVDMHSQQTFTAGSGWIHVLASWDATANKADLYINGLHDQATGTQINNADICYTAGEWGIGGDSTDGAHLDADIADLYAALGTYLDVSTAAVQAKFRDGNGKPVDLGVNCANPTGSAPIACLHGDFATWNVDKGTGGGFTVHGDGLTLATTNPAN